jgi:hypothetical protein
LSRMVNVAWVMFVAAGACDELVPPPHPTARTAKETTATRHKIALFMNAPPSKAR